MFKFLRSLLEQYRTLVKISQKPSEVAPPIMSKEPIEIDRLASAVSYNALKVPILAPDGFPKWAKIEALPGTEEFAYDVARAQKHLGLKADGFCGPSTINAMAEEDRKDHRSIIIGPKAYPVSSQVITYLDDPEIVDLSGRNRTLKIRQVCLHYDVTFNSMSTVSILRSRGLSYHFLIDGDLDATIYQTHNPTITACFHAGTINNYSVGICINNPADPSYQSRDEKNRGRKREKKSDTVHEENIERLEFFEEQLIASQELVSILCHSLDIPKVVPRDKDNKVLKGVIPNFEKFSGILGHYHVSSTKTDPSPLDWEAFLKD